MTTASDTPLCVNCHQAIGDEPAVTVSEFDGVAHRRCRAKYRDPEPTQLLGQQL